MTKNEIIERVQEKFDGLVLNENWGEVGLFYNPTYKLSKGIYLLTFKEKDGANDKASNVNREGVFRLNLGISKETFIKRFDEYLNWNLVYITTISKEQYPTYILNIESKAFWGIFHILILVYCFLTKKFGNNS